MFRGNIGIDEGFIWLIFRIKVYICIVLFFFVEIE